LFALLLEERRFGREIERKTFPASGELGTNIQYI
jgi:hypothetical protein